MAAKARILCYDLETPPYQAWVWGCGEQYVRHNQLVKEHDQPGIICVTYCWMDENKPAQCIDWGYEEQDSSRVVEEFDKIIRTADFTIGKNSDRFDTKVLNAVRMLNGLPGFPEWMGYKDDLEKQMRKYFKLPSQSLDYISGQLGLGGKIKMEFQDWIDIVEKNENGRKALAKMIKYGKKDCTDTRTLWNRLSEHFDSKWNQAKFQGDSLACKHMDCGSSNLTNRGSPRLVGATMYQEWRCLDCHRYAGRTTISKNGKYGVIK